MTAALHRALRGDETILKLMMVMNAQVCEYTGASELHTLNGRIAWSALKCQQSSSKTKSKSDEAPPRSAG